MDQSALDLAFTTIIGGAGIGGGLASIGIGLGIAKAALRAGGQWGADYDMQRAALDAQVELERARAQISAAAAAATAAAAAESNPRTYAPHITYAPHSTYNTTEGATTVRPPQPATEPAELPGVIDLADIHHRPTRHAILLGLAPGGQPLTVAARDLMHTGLIGASGGGKSNTGRLILAQLLACGVECVIADPHFTPYDAESDEDWRPIAQRLRIAPARKAGEIGDLFSWLSDELSRRLTLRASGERVGTPIVAYVDELPSIIANVEGAMSTLSELLREGRKVALYVVSASQDLLTKTLRTGGEIRENLRSCYYSGGAAHSAAPLLDMSRKEIGTYESRLGRGVVLLRSTATPTATLARVPLASNRAIVALLSDDATEASWKHTGSTLEAPKGATPRDPLKERIFASFSGGKDIRDIAIELCGSGSGRAYQEASKRVQETIRGEL